MNLTIGPVSASKNHNKKLGQLVQLWIIMNEEEEEELAYLVSNYFLNLYTDWVPPPL